MKLNISFDLSFISVAALVLILVNTTYTASAAGQRSDYQEMKSQISAQQQKFSQLDKNQDSSISEAEAKDSPDLAPNFNQLDMNGDQGIDSVEFSAFESRD
jgi:hypothetical protein